MIKIVTALVLGAVMSSANTLQMNFEKAKVGTVPTGWKATATHPKKALATWQVEEDAGNKILTLSNIDSSHGGMFNLCFTKSVDFLDGEISVRFRANSGQIDQGGGIMWRVQDADNYFVARFNPLEDNFRFYIVKEGVRMELASANVRLDKGWHRMKIVQEGTHFEGYLDDKKFLDYHDKRLEKSGGVGLWTKADAASSFDDFIVKTK